MTAAASGAGPGRRPVPSPRRAGPPPGTPEHRVSFKVYYEDTDSLGVVYYANYFRFLERGRSECLEASGQGVAQLNAAGVMVVVHSLEATFRNPARLGEVLDVVTQPVLESPYRLRFYQRLERERELVLSARIDCACLDAGGQLIPVPTSVVGALGAQP